jgi:hypothetical protein
MATVEAVATEAFNFFPAGKAYVAKCCNACQYPGRRTIEAAERDLADHDFARHGACHPRFCAYYKRHGSDTDGNAIACPGV